MKVSSEFVVTTVDGGYQAELQVSTTELLDSGYSFLCLSLVRPFQAGSLGGGELIERVGDWHKIKLDASYTGAEPLVLTFSGEGEIKKGTDYPDGIYLQAGDKLLEVELDRPIERVIESPDRHSVVANKAYAVMIPQCQEVRGKSIIECPHDFNFASGQWNSAWLQRLLTRSGTLLSLSDGADAWSVHSECVPELAESFRLSIEATGAKLRFQDQAGFHQGQAYLFQYVLQWIENGQLFSCELSGSPAYVYRGVHLDVVRHFFKADQISQWLDLFALFQFNHFHWHLTDDDGWRVPSNAYPQIGEIGAWRGPFEELPPQMGSGAARYGGMYTSKEIKRVVNLAAGIGIEVVPELDIPGHARSLLKSIPELVEPDDLSKYLSVQHHNDNVLNPAFGDTMSVLNTVLSEWCDLFPSKLFHVGSDEIPKGVWCESPTSKAWACSQGKSVSELQGYVLSAFEQYLKGQNKSMAGWEEVTEGGGTSTDTWVYSWQGIEAGQLAAAAGHNVIMTPAQYCYLDLSVTEGVEDPGYYWAGTLNMEKVYQYNPIDGIAEKDRPKIKGAQYCLWTELIETAEQAEYMLFPRLLAGAEVVWGSNTNESFEHFEARAEQWMGMLFRMGIATRAKRNSW